VQRIQRFGLNVRGGFIVGFDSDSPEIFERQIEFIQKRKIITAMVGMLNAPRGSRIYDRLLKEGRLSKEVTGDNTDFSTNIIPKMGYEKLAAGYRKIVSRIYSPRLYYERVREFLREYRPPEKRKWRFNFRYLRWHLPYLGAPFKTVLILGMKDKARLYYWKLLFWSLFNRLHLLPLALTYLIYGFHFRKVFKDPL
jgi:radical SAM superfamily enzyme YgiQ (UPF0313 family)